MAINTIILSSLAALFLYLACDFMFVEKIADKPIPEKEKQKITYRTIAEMIEQKAHETSKDTRDRVYINQIINKKQALSYRFRRKILDTVYSDYQVISMPAYVVLSVASALTGAYLSFIFNNFIVTILFIFFFLCIPYMLIHYYNTTQKAAKDKKLQMVMGNLSTAYIRSKTFLEAVESNLDIIPHPLKDDFKYFVHSTKYLQKNKVDAMIELKNRIGNDYFDKFMNLAINAELGEQGLKYTTLSLPADYKRSIDINEEFAMEAKEENKVFLVTLACFPSVLAFIRAMSSYYFDIITTTKIGQTAVTIIIIGLAIIGILFIQKNKPVKLKL